MGEHKQSLGGARPPATLPPVATALRRIELASPLAQCTLSFILLKTEEVSRLNLLWINSYFFR